MSSLLASRTPWWKSILNSVPEIFMIVGSIVLVFVGIVSTVFAVGATLIGLLGLVCKRRNGTI